MTTHNSHTYQFGPFKLVPTEKHLLREGHAVPLTPKAFNLLVVLVENAGHLVEKTELMNRVWPDSFVEEANLTVKMSELRRALGETSNENQYIETVPRRGYRFVAAVSKKSDASDEAVDSVDDGPTVEVGVDEDRSVVRRFWPAGVVALFVLAVLVYRSISTGALAISCLVRRSPS